MTKIEWTQETWNPIVGCSIVSPGCTNCYAMRQADRIQKMNKTNPHTGYVNHYDGTTKPSRAGPVFTGKVALAPDKIMRKPLGRKKPTTYFVNSMGDLFHENVPDEWINRVFAIMALCPQHTFQVLTKRSARMREYMERMSENYHGKRNGYMQPWASPAVEMTNDPCAASVIEDAGFPLPNVWLGISTEDQTRWDQRWPDLARTPAAIRFVSAEPLLGKIEMTGAGKLDWVIAGGESGKGSRPMNPAWAASIRDQCITLSVPFYFKQHGDWRSGCGAKPSGTPGQFAIAPRNGGQPIVIDFMPRMFDLLGSNLLQRIGKKAAGRTLDGRTHDEFPTTR